MSKQGHQKTAPPDDWDDPYYLEDANAPTPTPTQEPRPTLAGLSPSPQLPPSLVEPPMERAAAPAPPPPPVAVGAPTILLPVPFPERSFGVPAMACRSALFSAGIGKGQHGQARRSVDSYGTYSIELEGPRLTMRDKAAWVEVLRAGWRHGRLDEPFAISLSAIHKAVTGSTAQPSGTELGSVEESLRRLARAKVFYEFRKRRGGATLAEGSALMVERLDKSPGPRGHARWRAVLGSGWLPLLAVDVLCPVLPRPAASRPSELALWLRDLLGGNTAHEYDAGRLMGLSGYEGGKGRFSRDLQAALGDVGACWPRVLGTWELNKASRKCLEWRLKVEPTAAPSVNVSTAQAKPEVARDPEKAAALSNARNRHAAPKRRGGVAL